MEIKYWESLINGDLQKKKIEDDNNWNERERANARIEDRTRAATPTANSKQSLSKERLDGAMHMHQKLYWTSSDIIQSLNCRQK